MVSTSKKKTNKMYTFTNLNLLENLVCFLIMLLTNFNKIKRKRKNNLF